MKLPLSQQEVIDRAQREVISELVLKYPQLFDNTQVLNLAEAMRKAWSHQLKTDSPTEMMVMLALRAETIDHLMTALHRIRDNVPMAMGMVSGAVLNAQSEFQKGRLTS